MNLSRLVFINMHYLRDFPGHGADRTVDVRQANGQTMRRGTVKGHGYMVSLNVKWDGDETEEWINSTREEYSWVV